MYYKFKDPKTGEEVKNDLSVLPTITIPKDTMVLMTELLTPEQIGNVFCDLVNELYCDCQYDSLAKENSEKVFFERLKDNIGRLSMKYFTSIKNLKQNKDKNE